MTGATAAQAGVELVSALPSLGRATDIRDTSTVQSSAGSLTVFQSLSYRFADQKFDEIGKTVQLGLNQTVTIASAPLSVGYGVDERLTLGFTLPLQTRIRRALSLTSYAPGTSLFGQVLPVGQSARFVQRGEGMGDLTLNSQYRFSRDGADLTAVASLDVTAPTAESDPANVLDLPVGQGYWGFTPSATFTMADGAWTHLAKAGYELTARHVSRDASATRSVVKAGDGVNFTAGTSYRMHRGVAARVHLSGFERLGREIDGALRPGTGFRAAELRPGLTIHRGKVRWEADALVPVSGKNVLRTTGLFVTAGVSF